MIQVYSSKQGIERKKKEWLVSYRLARQRLSVHSHSIHTGNKTKGRDLMRLLGVPQESRNFEEQLAESHQVNFGDGLSRAGDIIVRSHTHRGREPVLYRNRTTLYLYILLPASSRGSNLKPTVLSANPFFSLSLVVKVARSFFFVPFAMNITV